ncbi:hypothetical protein [Hyalangium sp.]|uniref:hypothetical protein n=1 Tax=Hyalangium sp. TaxID=2028555 RepID=UPI002D3467AC|nr:hypothetical protein [Hyalangium sp.]HYI02840.1 hypothetical protein [Hyalangium sp.]
MIPRHLSLAPCASDAQPEALACAEPPQQPRLGLPALDQLALTAFATGDAAQLVEHVRGMAEVLASNDGDATRRRTISRHLAVTRGQTDLIDAAMGEALGRRDFEAVKALTKLADVQTRRFKMLLEEHRIELGRDQPVQMFVQHADSVTVGRR